jgi:hypothetical protein
VPGLAYSGSPLMLLAVLKEVSRFKFLPSRLYLQSMALLKVRLLSKVELEERV